MMMGKEREEKEEGTEIVHKYVGILCGGEGRGYSELISYCGYECDLA